MVAQTFATAISVLALCSQCKRGAYCLHLAPNPPAHIGIDREEPRLDENLSGLRRRRNIKRPGVKARRPLRVFCEKRTAVYSVSHGMPSREPRQWARFERAALLFQGRSQARSRPMENGFDGVRETIVSVGRVQFRHGQNMLVDVVGQPPLTELVVAPDFRGARRSATSVPSTFSIAIRSGVNIVR